LEFFSPTPPWEELELRAFNRIAIFLSTPFLCFCRHWAVESSWLIVESALIEAMPNPWPQFLLVLVALSLTTFLPSALAQKSAITFAGVSLSPGATVRAEVPLSAQEKSYASEGGNSAPANAVAVIAVPRNFDPQKSWPVLIVFSTSDFNRLNRDDLVEFYRPAALAEGWVLLAGDAAQFAPRDTTGWRAAMTLAALDALHVSFPGSKKWPVACAGFSGGSKRAGLVAPLLSLAGNRVIGIYLTGINQDRLSDGYRQFQPGPAFLNTPIFVSSGKRDNIAKLDDQYRVKASMEQTGFRRVRLETFSEGHVVETTRTREALRWFRSLENSR
jgi:hypothetical protein